MRKHSSRRLAGACVALLVLAGAAANVAAQAVSPEAGDTLSLSDEQKADVLSHNSESSVDAARAGLGSGGPDRKIHGEVGVMVGTNGARAAYGTAAIPLGDNAGAVVSFESSHFGRPH
jgi:opacity protein-like surface antigen